MLTTLSHYHGRPNHGPTQETSLRISDKYLKKNAAVYPWLEQSEVPSHATGEEVGEGRRRKRETNDFRAPLRDPRRRCGLALLGRMFPADTNLPQPAVITAPPRGALRHCPRTWLQLSVDALCTIHRASPEQRRCLSPCVRAAVSYIIPRYDRN